MGLSPSRDPVQMAEGVCHGTTLPKNNRQPKPADGGLAICLSPAKIGMCRKKPVIFGSWV